MIIVKTAGFTQAMLAIDRRIASLRDIRLGLEAATEIVYEATRQRFDSSGNGSWPPLAESTVQRKESQGAADPARPLYEQGNLYESATSPSGPYSMGPLFPSLNSVVIGIDWEENGYQIPRVLSEGAGEGGAFPGRGGGWHIPARPIWPPAPELVLPVREALIEALAL